MAFSRSRHWIVAAAAVVLAGCASSGSSAPETQVALPATQAKGPPPVVAETGTKSKELLAPPMSAVALRSSLCSPLSFGLLLIKRTYQPSVLRRNRKFGFLGRTQTKAGRDLIARRVAKGRKRVSVAFTSLMDHFT